MKIQPTTIEEEVKKFEEKYTSVWNSRHSEFIRIPDGIKGNMVKEFHDSLTRISLQSREDTLKEVKELAEEMKKEVPIHNEFKLTAHSLRIATQAVQSHAYNEALDSLINQLKI